MTTPAVLEILLSLAIVVALARPLGLYAARIFGAGVPLAEAVLGPVERMIYALAGPAAARDQTWREYASGVLVLSGAGLAVVYGLQRLQAHLPLNPDALPPVEPLTAFNAAISFVTNTNWQSWPGETTMSHLTRLLGLGVQQFVSAATGMAVFAALCRGLSRTEVSGLGNFWRDVTRATLYILLPLSLLLALFLASQGVVQNFAGKLPIETLAGHEQVVAGGPAASAVAIKQLGTNGGGFFGANGAHPLENPTPLSNFVQTVSLILLPAALCIAFGELVGKRRQGWALLAVVLLVFVPCVATTVWAETRATPTAVAAQLDAGASPLQPGGNMEGKESRFGPGPSALWAVSTTAASNGSANAAHDSFTPLGILPPLLLMQLGEIIFGGVGSGVYGLVVFCIIAVFLSGLMVGRTPEFLGKKIEPFEMKMAALVVLIPGGTVLAGTALAALLPAAAAAAGDPGPHGFTRILYALSSASNNNGSAMGGLGAGAAVYETLLGAAMWIGRFGVIIPVLALSGSLGRKKRTPISSGTLPTDSSLFIVFLVAVIITVGALTFVPALALGPVVEELRFTIAAE